MYQLFRTSKYLSQYSTFDKSLQFQIDRLEQQLQLDPFVGKPLGTSWFREKKFGKYRLYYLIYSDLVVVYLISFSDKKTQRKQISLIRRLFKIYRAEVEQLLNR